MPTTFTWVGSTSDPTTASNWSGGSVGATPGAGDTAIFANSQPCDWTISSIGTIQIKDSYTGILTIATDVAITGLDIQAEGQLDASAARVLTFSGTPLTIVVKHILSMVTLLTILHLEPLLQEVILLSK